MTTTASAPRAATRTVGGRRGHRGSLRRRRWAVAAFLRTSPGRLSLITGALVVLTILTGIVLSSTVSSRATDLGTLIGRTEPLAGAAQNLYSALSEADATAASAFLTGGLESNALREGYTRSTTAAAAALGTAAVGAGADVDDASRTSLATLSTQLPVYTGLVETARANNQQGFPVGAAYLREASALMQSRLLPAAEQLYNDYSAASAQQSLLARPPWWGLVLGLVTVSCLVLAQRSLRRRTRRSVNVGLALASVAIVVAMGWAAAASVLGASRLDDGRTNGSEPLALLAHSRLLAQQARADETLMLVARSDAAGYEKAFSTSTTDMSGLLEQLTSTAPSSATAAASAAAQSWTAAHRRVSKANDSGDYVGAVALALGSGAQDSGAQFTALDNALRDGIAQARTVLTTKASAARSTFVGLSPGVLVLSLLAAAAVAAGMWPRLREYQ